MEVPKSKFVKNKIKNLKLNSENKKYIEDLLLLEKFVLEGDTLGWAGGFLANNKSKEYSQEYKAIYKELDTKEYKKHLGREKKLRS